MALEAHPGRNFQRCGIMLGEYTILAGKANILVQNYGDRALS
jgi:hypothetical protein